MVVLCIPSVKKSRHVAAEPTKTVSTSEFVGETLRSGFDARPDLQSIGGGQLSKEVVKLLSCLSAGDWGSRLRKAHVQDTFVNGGSLLSLFETRLWTYTATSRFI